MDNTTVKTPKRTRWLRALCIVIAVLLLAAIPVALGPVVEPKYLTTSKEGSLTEEYYASVAETNHDVLFIGDCEVFESFIPAILWEEYGISSYVRGGAQQLTWHSYYLLEDACATRPPRPWYSTCTPSSTASPSERSTTAWPWTGWSGRRLSWMPSVPP